MMAREIARIGNLDLVEHERAELTPFVLRISQDCPREVPMFVTVTPRQALELAPVLREWGRRAGSRGKGS